eukprot:1235404-Rhodomonas_salina.1
MTQTRTAARRHATRRTASIALSKLSHTHPFRSSASFDAPSSGSSPSDAILRRRRVQSKSEAGTTALCWREDKSENKTVRCAE